MSSRSSLKKFEIEKWPKTGYLLLMHKVVMIAIVAFIVITNNSKAHKPGMIEGMPIHEEAQ